MDNCSIHTNTILDAHLDDGNFEYMFLPPYSPNLNPIENVFGILKNQFRTLMASEHYKNRMLATKNAPGGTRGQLRDEILDEAFDVALTSVSPEIVNVMIICKSLLTKPKIEKIFKNKNIYILFLYKKIFFIYYFYKK